MLTFRHRLNGTPYGSCAETQKARGSGNAQSFCGSSRITSAVEVMRHAAASNIIRSFKVIYLGHFISSIIGMSSHILILSIIVVYMLEKRITCSPVSVCLTKAC
ncbi:hypothetical protein EUGRSUZ_I02755 [Eucalyptus grandis]|uniref:Uncharacterized protein n=2 Tax=Eucalyptus grandis TaxID=71139 RepID=A0ACC3JJZ9_EUCGR|nr:hypothetical protein EUGRSUZ_I02755 [Eucalyptus grandis]